MVFYNKTVAKIFAIGIIKNLGKRTCLCCITSLIVLVINLRFLITVITKFEDIQFFKEIFSRRPR